MKRKVLLIEPNYKNKYPPMPLMKLATYYKQNKDDVRFFKGDLRDLAAQLLCEKLYKELSDSNLARYFDILRNYIKVGKTSILDVIPGFQDQSDNIEKVKKYRIRYMRKEFKFFDIVAVTTLFTFYWKQTIDTINDCKMFVKKNGKLFVGGIAATILPDYIESETGITPIVGLLDKPGMLDEGNDCIIDELPLDYSILEEIDYTYPAHDAYFSYMTRGCIRNCAFCAVKKLEPKYRDYIGIKHQIECINNRFGAQTNLLLMDNNVFASDKFYEIVDEIKECGFGKGAYFEPPSAYDIAFTNIKKKYNIRAYIKKMISIYDQIATRLDEDEAGEFYTDREIYDLLYVPSATRKSIIEFDDIAKPLYEKHFKRIKRNRYIDFNQGVDARLVTAEKMEKLSELAIRPLRIAFDHYEQSDVYEAAVRLAARYGITHLSNYLLYNFMDKPEELYYRMKRNVDLCEELDVRIYSFPMKYHPIDDPLYFKNRDYIGKYWNRKFIRAVQAVLNATKGKIGRGISFFEEAFGADVLGFHKILWMPETFIIERFKYKDNLTEEWYTKFNRLKSDEEKLAKQIISSNNFDDETLSQVTNKQVLDVLKYYKIKK